MSNDHINEEDAGLGHEYMAGDTLIRWRTTPSPEGAARREDTLEIGDIKLIITRDPFGTTPVTTSVDSEGLLRNDLPDEHSWNAGARALLTTIMTLAHHQIVRISDHAFHDSLLMALDRLKRQNEMVCESSAVLVVPRSALQHVACTQNLSDEQLGTLITRIQDSFTNARVGSGRPGDLVGQLLEAVIEECVADMEADASPAP
ncbi:hypothetical protein [Alcanivorax sp. 1008]|uniref:hypothetical protein n=1 Tax=Alcanivorax sp. 1008 TaxID=2816853 RepID=UPI001DAB7316|nr:hypothetical protein [Alcanivorax sp. 1008]MCC1496883.1 hypothetical protein [Alcanivorax sp. 1008]